MNPWKNLTAKNGKWIATCDLENFKKRVSIISSHRTNSLKLNYPPEPFIGNKNAKVYLLLANPDVPKYNKVNKAKSHQIIFSKNLNHKLKKFYPLHKNTEVKWWQDVLLPLIRDLGLENPKNTLRISQKGLSRIDKNLFCIEMYGYHSKKFNPNIISKLPSVKYSALLVKKAIQDRKLILIPRSIKQWFNLVPELAWYPKCHIIGTNRSIRLSQSTISPKAMLEIAHIFKCLPYYVNSLLNK
jgi:hypothetical protein